MCIEVSVSPWACESLRLWRGIAQPVMHFGDLHAVSRSAFVCTPVTGLSIVSLRKAVVATPQTRSVVWPDETRQIPCKFLRQIIRKVTAGNHRQHGRCRG